MLLIGVIDMLLEVKNEFKFGRGIDIVEFKYVCEVDLGVGYIRGNEFENEGIFVNLMFDRDFD